MDQAEARSLRSQADELEAGSTPDPLLAEFMRHDAAALEKSSANALALVKSPSIGSGGELVPTGGQVKRGVNLIDTVERPDAITAEASMDRLKLADGGIECIALAVDAAETIQAANSIEKMMAHQLAATGYRLCRRGSPCGQFCSPHDGCVPEGHSSPTQAQNRRQTGRYRPTRQRHRWRTGPGNRGH